MEGTISFSDIAHTQCEHQFLYFSPITGIKVMISGIAFDRVSRVRAFPYDHFKIYKIGAIFPSDRDRNRPGSISI